MKVNIKMIDVFQMFSLFSFSATEKAKKFVTQLNEQMKLYPEGYDTTKMMNDEQRGQYVEQKEVKFFLISFLVQLNLQFY